MSETFQNPVGAGWVASRSGSTFADENPSERGSVLGHFQASTPADMTAAIDAAAEAFGAWRRIPVGERQALTGRFLGRLRDAREALAGIVCRENGKTIREARAEVDSALQEGSYHMHQVSRLVGETLPAGTPGLTGWTEFEPVGVVGVISPWNFPMNVMCRKTLPALLTGNTVVFKPASFTPWTGVHMAGLFQQAGFPAGVFNCVTGQGSAIGSALVDDPRVRAVSFTGSTAVGRAILARAARNLTRAQLELGGKNAVIVMADADLDEALNAVVAAGFACAGQWCTSTSRILVQEPVHRRFREMLVARCERMVVGEPLDETTEMGPVAGPEQYASICAAIEGGGRAGARRLTGGPAEDAAGRRGYFIRPTVFDAVHPDMALFTDEIFGPVLAVTPFGTLEEGLALANRSSYGLSSALFTRDVSAAQRYIREIQSGLAHVNIHTGFKHPALPFGGWKESGYGLPENGRTGLEFFVERKAVYVRAPEAEISS
jgi:aldehyde dehydrogenase (NAD+)